nr:DUF6356 family protein [Kordiimonas laminariae]
MKKLFTEHPETVGESYFEHMGQAFSFGSSMLLNGIACLLHGFFPFLFVKTGSEAITKLHDRMVLNRDRRKPRVSNTEELA